MEEYNNNNNQTKAQRRFEISEKFKIKQRELMTKLQQFTADFNNNVNKELDVLSDDMNVAVDNINKTINNLGQAFNRFNELQKQDQSQPLPGQTSMFDNYQQEQPQPQEIPIQQPIKFDKPMQNQPEMYTPEQVGGIQVDTAKEQNVFVDTEKAPEDVIKEDVIQVDTSKDNAPQEQIE